MQTTTEIAAQIAAVQGSIRDLERSLPSIYDRGDDAEQEDAETRLVALQNRSKRLQDRLTVAKQEEAQKAEQTRLAGLRQELEDARDRHAALTAELTALVMPLARSISEEALPEIDRIAALRSAADHAHQATFEKLNPGKVTSPLSVNMGLSLVPENPPEHFEVVQLALFILINTKRGLPGGYDDAVQGLAIRSQQDAAHRRLAFGPREPEPVRPGATAQEQDAEVRASFYANLRNNGGQIAD